MDHYKVEKVRQGNGPELTKVKKVTDSKPITVNNSIDGVGGGTNASPSGFYNGSNVQDVRSVRGVGSATEKPKGSIFDQAKKETSKKDNVVYIDKRKNPNGT